MEFEAEYSHLKKESFRKFSSTDLRFHRLMVEHAVCYYFVRQVSDERCELFDI